MLLRHVNSQRTKVAYKPVSFLWKLLFANYPFFTSQDWPHEHAASRDTCVINFSELDQFSFHHCPLQKGLFFFFFPTTASNFVEGVAGSIQSQEPSDIKRGTAHRQCFPCRARVSPCLHLGRAGSPDSSSESQRYLGALLGVTLRRGPCPWRDPARRAANSHTQEEGYQPTSAFAFSLSPQGNPQQKGKRISASKKSWQSKDTAQDCS